MQITIKLYAMLIGYLPDNAERNVGTLELNPDTSVATVVKQLNLPMELVHLVLVNGVYIYPEEQLNTLLKEGDALAIWPPVAGG